MNEITAQTIVKKYDTLDGYRGTYKATLQEICDYVLPHKHTVTNDYAPGTKRMATVYDGTAIQALNICANGLYGHLTNPSSPWFQLTCKRKDLNEMPDVKEWLKNTTERMHDAINTSNWPMAAHEVYTCLPAFGTSVMYLGKIQTRRKKRQLLNFKVYDICDCVIEEDADGEVDTVIRREKMTVRQIIQNWPDSCSREVSQAYEKGNHEQTVQVLHAVFPRSDRNPDKWDRENKPWASYYLERETQTILEEGGFEEFPYMVPRWSKKSGTPYGTGPGQDCLSEIKMINEFSKSDIKVHQKRADPPVLVPDEMAMYPKRFIPGGITYYKAGTKPEYMVGPSVTQYDLEYENQRRNFIMSMFFADLFTLLAQQPRAKTATEVMELVEERLVLLGPTLGRLQSELFDVMLSRVFWLLIRGDEMGGYIMLPPPALIGQGLDIMYVSKLAMAMRVFEVKAVMQSLGFAQNVAQIDPSVMDNFALDQIARGVAERYGTPTIFMAPDRAVREIRAKRAQQQAEQQQRQDKLMQAEMAQKMTPAMTTAPEPGSPAAMQNQPQRGPQMPGGLMQPANAEAQP